MNLRSQSGQMITEAILILVMMMSFTFIISNYIRDQEVLKTLISSPWQSLAGVLQNGVWGPVAKTNSLHPNAHIRHIVIQGEASK